MVSKEHMALFLFTLAGVKVNKNNAMCSNRKWLSESTVHCIIKIILSEVKGNRCYLNIEISFVSFHQKAAVHYEKNSYMQILTQIS